MDNGNRNLRQVSAATSFGSRVESSRRGGFANFCLSSLSLSHYHYHSLFISSFLASLILKPPPIESHDASRASQPALPPPPFLWYDTMRCGAAARSGEEEYQE